MDNPELEFIKTNLRRRTFEAPKMKKWVEDNSYGYVLNIFAGSTRLDLNEVRNDSDSEADAEYCMDAVDFARE